MAEAWNRLGAEVGQLGGVIRVVRLKWRGEGAVARTVALRGEIGVSGSQANWRDWRRDLRRREWRGRRSRRGNWRCSEDWGCDSREHAASIAGSPELERHAGHAVVELDKELVFVHLAVWAAAVETLGVLLKSLVA